MRHRARCLFSLCVGLYASSIVGCDFFKLTASTDSIHLPLPTKDEVALVDGKALSIQDFFRIRTQLQTRSSEMALWVGISTLVLQSQAHADSKEISPHSAYEIARYAIRDLPYFYAEKSLKDYYSDSVYLPTPDEVKKEIDALTQKALVRRNPMHLSLLN